MEAIGNFFGTFFGPIGEVFHVLFYLPVYNVLMVIYEALNTFFPAGAFALAIVILTLIIRSALIPLTRKQLASTRKMQLIQPQLKALQQQYRGDPQTLMAEQRRLYKENGVSMYGGCLPLLVQMPFLYALYYSFFAILSNREKLSDAAHLAVINKDLYPFVPHLTALPHTQFLWTNLATPDPWHVLPVVAALLTFIQMRMAMPVRKPRQPGENPDPTMQATATTMYIMPLITLFFGWTFPSGLALYWCISTGFSAGQQYFINGNFGSLFVGVPGMEHLVPEPKDLTPTVTRQPTDTSGGSGRTARITTAATGVTPAEGGLRGLWSRIRENAAVAQTQAMERAEQARREREEAAAQAQAERQAAERDETTGKGALPRRQRPARQGPVLVRPAQPAQTPQPSAPAEDGAAGGDDVAQASQEATDKTVLPEQKMANGTSGAAGKNGASGAGGNVAARPTTGVHEPQVSNGSSKSTGANKPGGTRPTAGGSSAARKSGAKGGSGSQSRSGRSKRGR